MIKKTTQKRTPVLPRVLTFLARNTEANKWQIKKQLGASYSNVYNAIEGLLEDKMIRISKTKRSEKNPKIDVKYYELTFYGLVVSLTFKKTWDHIDEIANAQKDKIPLIFGKWDFFGRKGVRDRIIERLKNKISMMITRPQNLETLHMLEEIIQKQPRDIFEKIYKDNARAEAAMKDLDYWVKQFDQTLRERYLTNAVLGLSAPFSPAEELTKFMSVFKEDLELREYIRKEIAGIEKSYMEYLKNIKSWKSWWERA